MKIEWFDFIVYLIIYCLTWAIGFHLADDWWMRLATLVILIHVWFKMSKILRVF